MIGCIIFDSDGTLVDSEFLGHYCMELQLKQVGIFEDANSMKEDFRGWKLHNILEVISKRNSNFEFSENFIPDYRTALNILFEKELTPIKDVKQAVTEIQLPKCVASSGPMHKIKTALKVTGLVNLFDKLYSAYDLNCWKPDPGLFLHAAQDMGFAPNECLVIEDSQVGVEAAINAGMKVIHYNPESIKLNGVIPDLEIHSMNDLLEGIESFS